MLKRLMGITKKRPLHLRHEPSFVEQQHPLAPGNRDGRDSARPHPAARVPTLSIEQARDRKAAANSLDEADDRQRTTTLDALDQIRKQESTRYSDLGVN